MDDPLFKVLVRGNGSNDSNDSNDSNGNSDHILFQECDTKVVEQVLEELRDLSVNNIHNETAHVVTSLDSVQQRLVSLTAKSHRSLLDTCDSLQTLSTQLDQFTHSLAQLSQLGSDTSPTTLAQDVQALLASEPESAGTHSTSTGDPNTTHTNTDTNTPTTHKTTINKQTASILLRNTDKVTELLEVPSLVQACVRNTYYTEALDLWTLTRRLVLRYPQHRIMQQIAASVDHEIQTVMTARLVSSLRTSPKMATVSKSVNLLKRISARLQSQSQSQSQSQTQPTQTPVQLTPASIQLLYLASRLEFIKTQWKTLDSLKRSGSAHAYLKRYIEIFREHVFATVSTAHMLFGEASAEPASSSVPTSMQQANSLLPPQTNSLLPPQTTTTPTTTPTTQTPMGPATQPSTAQPVPRQTQNPYPRLLSQYVTHASECVYNALKEQAPKVYPVVGLKSIWLQLAYCSQSLGRVGAEFWPLMQGRPDCPIPREDWQEVLQRQRDLSRDVATRLSS